MNYGPYGDFDGRRASARRLWRHASAEATRRELADIAKAIAEIVRVVEQGGWHSALVARLTELQARQNSCQPVGNAKDGPDIHPGLAGTFRRRVERLTTALAHPHDALEAADAIRGDHRPHHHHPRQEARQLQHHPAT
jgi:hypothetical protein